MKRLPHHRRAKGSGRRPRHGRDGRPADAGDTLIEIIVAVAIIGISATGILGGLAAALGSSGTHRSLTTLDAIVKSFVETAKYNLQQQAKKQQAPSQVGPMFKTCASISDYTLASAPYPSSGPVGTAVTVFGSGFPNGSTPSVSLTGPSGRTPVTSQNNPITNGELNLTFAIPPLPAGPETVTITDNGVTTNASTLTVTPLIQLDPASAPPGTGVNATVTGFAATSSVTVRFGGQLVKAGPTDANGSATLPFTVPSGFTATQPVTAADGTNQAIDGLRRDGHDRRPGKRQRAGDRLSSQSISGRHQ